MKYVNEVEYDWTATCPECGAGYNEWDEQVDISGSHPVITCDHEEFDVTCNCVFEVSCVEC